MFAAMEPPTIPAVTDWNNSIFSNAQKWHLSRVVDALRVVSGAIPQIEGWNNNILDNSEMKRSGLDLFFPALFSIIYIYKSLRNM